MYSSDYIRSNSVATTRSINASGVVTSIVYVVDNGESQIDLFPYGLGFIPPPGFVYPPTPTPPTPTPNPSPSPTPIPSPSANSADLRLRETPARTENTFNSFKQLIATKLTFRDGTALYDAFIYGSSADVLPIVATYSLPSASLPAPAPTPNPAPAPTPNPSPVLSGFAIGISGLFLTYNSTIALTTASGTISINGIQSALTFNSSGTFRVSQVKQGDIVTVSVASTTPTSTVITAASVANYSTYAPNPTPTPNPVPMGIVDRVFTSGGTPVREDQYLNAAKQIINSIYTYSDGSRVYGAFTYADSTALDYLAAAYGTQMVPAPIPTP